MFKKKKKSQEKENREKKMDTETRKERDGKRKKNIQKYIGRRKSETKKSDAVALFVEDPCKESVVLEQSRYFTLYLY